MCIFEFDEELFKRDERDTGREEGRAEAFAEVICKLHKNMSSEQIAELLELEEAEVKKICDTVIYRENS